MINKALGLLLGMLTASAVAQKKSAKIPSLSSYIPTRPTTDNSTFANTDYIQDYHMHIDWDYVFWTNSTILGSVTHDCRVIQETDFATFDFWGQTIINVTAVAAGEAQAATREGRRVNNLGAFMLNYTITSPDPASGSVLTVEFPTTMPVGSSYGIQIFYTTAPNSMALTWLTPAQTAGGVYPYLFSQSEDINGRSMIPM